MSVLAVGALAAERGTGRPETQAGPFRVVIDRIAQSRNTLLNYRTTPAGRDGGSAQSRRSVQLQMQVLTQDRSAAAGLASFQVNGLSAEAGRRTVTLSHSGGILESPDERAVLRAYLYVPACPSQARELRAMEGELVAYEKAGECQIDVPLTGKLPSSATKEGVRATVQAMSVQGTNLQATVELAGPEGTALVATTSDGAYGVSLFNADSRGVTPTGGSVSQPRANTATYRLAFQSPQDTPRSLRIRFVYRGGARRVYPFRIEHIPIPARLAAGAPPAPAGQQEQR